MGSDPKAGRLLVATPLLGDPNFKRTVVLIVEHEVTVPLDHTGARADTIRPSRAREGMVVSQTRVARE